MVYVPSVSHPILLKGIPSLCEYDAHVFIVDVHGIKFTRFRTLSPLTGKIVHHYRNVNLYLICHLFVAVLLLHINNFEDGSVTISWFWILISRLFYNGFINFHGYKKIGGCELYRISVIDSSLYTFPVIFYILLCHYVFLYKHNKKISTLLEFGFHVEFTAIKNH